ncbi:MAG: tRNA uridine-5-carboxymethylaminomethyl(34) synthesis GTPase MnmE [Chromatiales bacterium]|jgi:tRNA modification GTPase
MTDTIAAQATAPGQGGVGVIRIAGPLAKQIAEQITHQSHLPARTVLFTRFYDQQQEVLDEGLLLFFPAPASFTGDDVIEFQTHGSPVILDLLLATACVCGARLARPGEFSERAFLNGKIDLAQAEAIADLIESGTETAARLASRSLQGVFSQQVHELVEALTNLRMYVEAAIDFPEEEIDFLSDGKIEQQFEAIVTKLADVLEKAHQGSLIREGMTLVIAGLPNAGKSSLLNALCGHDKAIVTDVPGTTRDVLSEQIQIDGMPLHIIDTAGLRESADAVEQEGIRRAHEQISKADRILWVYDAKQDPQHSSYASSILPKNIPVTFIRNKVDLLEEQAVMNAEQNEIALSAKQGIGLDLLREHLKDVMGLRDPQQGDFLARRRHLDALRKAAERLQQARHVLLDLRAGELFAEELRLAQDDLGEITGAVSSDDLLGRIFSSFCIGK